jgi:nitroreductase
MSTPLPGSDERIFDVMYQCRAMRRLKPDPVPDEMLLRLVDAALQGPSGSNAQNWAFVIVRDPAQKRRIQALWQRAWHFYRDTFAGADLRPHEDAGGRERMMRAADYLADHLHEVPALIFVAVRRDEAFSRVLTSPGTFRRAVQHLGPTMTARFLASGLRTSALADGATAYPAVQNLLLAARALGLGSVLTTLHFFLPGEFERVIDLPSSATLAAIVPVGFPRGRFGPVSRPDARSVVSWDRWQDRPAAPAVAR